MVVHAVKFEDLEAALMSARKEAGVILEQVNLAQDQLAATRFVGQQADELATQMNDKMSQFVTATYENVDAVLYTIVQNMNVVVTKLGGAPWDHVKIERGAANTASTFEDHQGSTNYQIDTQDMSDFATMVDGWFEDIVTSYNNLRGTVIDGTPTWEGPEKQVTTEAVDTAVTQIIGTAGDESGTGVRGVGASLSGWLREQVSRMES